MAPAPEKGAEGQDVPGQAGGAEANPVNADWHEGVQAAAAASRPGFSTGIAQ